MAWTVFFWVTMVLMARLAPDRASSISGNRASTRAVRILVAVVVLGVVVLTGCSGGETDKSSQAPGNQPTAANVKLGSRWPLTGLPTGGAAVRHPVMVVKIDNTQSSSPQIGLRAADLVTEELVEGGSTRLAAFFYQHVPKLVGPVRSMRATDIGVVKPADAVLVAAGGAPPTVQRIRSAKIKTFGEGAPGFRRDNSRSAPYNLFVDLAALAHTLKARELSENYLPWGDDDSLPRGRAAVGLSATFSGAHSTKWKYQGGTYANLNTFAGAGDEFRPDTVLVLRVRVGDAGYLDPAGNPVPETFFTGKGTALIFHKGRVLRGVWEKDLDTTIRLRTQAGELHLPPGRVWIELVPSKGGHVAITR
jgi:Protein of unknown function (DUF3048) N-terminal domain/Protein of unknown function (DUF3048) C-terminal domain